MDIILKKGKALSNAAEAISSKSYVHRLIIASALCTEPVDIITNIISKDMRATVDAVNALGGSITIEEDGDGCHIIRTVSGIPFSEKRSGITIDCNESGSTARFIIPVAAFAAQSVTVTGRGKLPARPMKPLCDVLTSAGVSVSGNYLPITLSGMPHSGRYTIPGNVSSQFVSGLLFMLPLLCGNSELEIKGALESKPYVDMTVDVIQKFGITIKKNENGFFIPGDQKYHYASGTGTRNAIKAEGDWSNGAYMMAIAAFGCGKVFDSFTISGLDQNSIQGDRAAVRIFEDFGIGLETSREAGGTVIIKSGPKKPVDVDCSQIPDLVPALAVLAAYTDGVSTFRNVERLRIKECDRIDAIGHVMHRIGAKCEAVSHGSSEDLVIHGKGAKRCADKITVNSHNDHRIAMAAAALCFAEDVPVVIEDALATDKSYPGFYDVMARIGMETKNVI